MMELSHVEFLLDLLIGKVVNRSALEAPGDFVLYYRLDETRTEKVMDEVGKIAEEVLAGVSITVDEAQERLGRPPAGGPPWQFVEDAFKVWAPETWARIKQQPRILTEPRPRQFASVAIAARAAHGLFPIGDEIMAKSDQLRAALAKIAEVANSAVQGEVTLETEEPQQKSATSTTSISGCIIKTLPPRLLVQAAATAIKINPVNAPALGALPVEGDGGHVLPPSALASMTSKYWGPNPRRLTVSFMESATTALRTRILSHMNAWTKTCCISFVETNGIGDVRISREPGGYWSYLGTDILHIPKNRPTMNLEGFSMGTEESEYRRVVRHETGHTLSFPHEHMRKALVERIDPQKAYRWFWEHYHWPKEMVDAQVLTPLDEASLMGTPADQTSIMCYQLPGAITKDGQPIPGGTDINATDYAFAGKIYPKLGQTVPAVEEDWAESEDVEVTV